MWWVMCFFSCVFFFSSRRRHTRLQGDWSSDVCSSDLPPRAQQKLGAASGLRPSAAPTSCTAKAGRCFGAPPLCSPPLVHSKSWALLRGSAPLQPPPHAQQKLGAASGLRPSAARSEEHTSELQSPCNLVCRLLLEKKKMYTPKRLMPSA